MDLYITPQTSIVLLIFAAVLGSSFGSFINCLAWRRHHHVSAFRGRSRCPECGHSLSFCDLVPIVSWLALGGKCRWCHKAIAKRYLVVELIGALIFVSVCARYNLSLHTVELLIFACILLFASLTDLDDWLIPNGCIITALIVHIVYMLLRSLFNNGNFFALFEDALLGGIVILIPLFCVMLITDKILGHPSMGGGDLKLLFVTSFYFGWHQGLLLIIVACVIGIALSFITKKDSQKLLDTQTTGKKTREPHFIPFGPAIALASWFVMLAGPNIVACYLAFFL